MIELEIGCTGAQPDRGAAGPTIALRLRLAERTGRPVHALVLRCQLRIEPARRRYDDTEAAAVRDLFGDRSRWGATLQPMQLGQLSQAVPGFEGETTIELLLPCSYDVDVAAGKYLHALTDGEIPLLLLFSGTVFTRGEQGVEVEPVPWHLEARYRLPVRVWRETMDLHFPGTAWVRLDRETFDALHRYRAGEQLRDADEALQRLLKEVDR